MEASWVGIIVVLILVTMWHELGHLCAARILRIPIKRIGIGFGPTLWRFATTAQTEVVLRALPLGMSIGTPGRRDECGQLRRPVAHDIWMAAAGPLASFLLSLLLFALLGIGSFSPAVAYWFIGAGLLSAFLALLNLLPIPGLDGGHLLILAIAQRGWQLPPRQEIRLHKMGIQSLAIICLLSLVVQTWQWLGS